MRFLGLVGIVFCLLVHASTYACTAFQLKAEDGTWVYGRSLEFGFRMGSDLLIVPRGTPYTGTALNNKPGLKWKTRYGFARMNQLVAQEFVSEGMNEKGLVVGMLYFPQYARYEPSTDAESSRTLGPWELAAYLLGSCSTVSEAKEVIEKVIVGEVPNSDLGGFVIPLHYYVADRSGAAIVIEYTDGKRHVYDNPLGALTNSPPFEWHLTHLTRYINLSPVNVPVLKLSDWTVRNLGQGSGLLGLPGDYTPSSRFVRAVLFSQWAAKPVNAEDAVRLGFHILNTFDIFEGIVRTTPGEDNNLELPLSKVGIDLKNDLTEWVVVHDRTNLKTYIRTYNNLQVQMVDLSKLDFSKGGLRSIKLPSAFTAVDITEKTTPLQLKR
ncbi:MAG: linear amide C-N hydrolase [Verrucomicrobia bacterium]|nr:linear amide C-N hydrolase [Verrucomicrobiota bacterium]